MTVAETLACLTGWSARLRPALVIGVALTLGACSSTPEWADPTALWDKAFGEEEDARPADAADTDSNGSFPNLGSTPEQPKTSTAAQRQAVANSLIADRDRAKYTDQTLRTQGASALPPPSTSAAQEATTERAAKATETLQDTAKTAGKTAMAEGRRMTSEATDATRSSDLQSRAVTPAIRSERMRVPSIVQRAGRPLPPPTPVEEVARGRSPASIIRQSTPEPLRPSDALQNSARGGSADSMPTRTEQAGTQQMAKPVAPAAPAATESTASGNMAAVDRATAPERVDAGVANAAAMAAAANVNLPVGQDQQTLEQVFASQIAAQNNGLGSQRAVLPTTMASSTPGTAFPARPGNAVNGHYPNAGGAARLSGVNGDDGLRLPGAPMVVRFANGATALDGKAQRQVAKVATMLRERGGSVRVVGHASQRTADMPYAKHKIVNFNVSLDRANAVAQALARRGVPRDSIIVEARGDEDPLFYEFMPNGEAYNRRVEIFLQ